MFPQPCVQCSVQSSCFVTWIMMAHHPDTCALRLAQVRSKRIMHVCIMKHVGCTTTMFTWTSMALEPKWPRRMLGSSRLLHHCLHQCLVSRRPIFLKRAAHWNGIKIESQTQPGQLYQDLGKCAEVHRERETIAVNQTIAVVDLTACVALGPACTQSILQQTVRDEDMSQRKFL